MLTITLKTNVCFNLVKAVISMSGSVADVLLIFWLQQGVKTCVSGSAWDIKTIFDNKEFKDV